MQKHQSVKVQKIRSETDWNSLTLVQKRAIILGIASRDEMPKAPGQNHRNHIASWEAVETFGNENVAEEWLIQKRWNGVVRCPKCNSDNIRRNDKVRLSMRFFCRPCRRYFSVKSGTMMHNSKLPLFKWALAMYENTSVNLKGISALKLHHSVKVTYSTAWHLNHRIRASQVGGIPENFRGPVEVDECHIGGKAKTMSKSRYRKLKDMGLLGGGARHMTHVIAMRDRATGMVVAEVLPTLQKSTVQAFILKHTYPDTVVYTDEARYYIGLDRPHARVNHKAKVYADGEVTTNSIESMWATIKMAIRATFHNVSPKHVERYVFEFVGKHNARPLDTIDQMTMIVRNMEGKRLPYAELTKWTGDNRYTVIVE